MKLITADQMRHLDQQTIAAGTPGETLMERAGRGIFQELLLFLDRRDDRHVRRCVILTGKGNNGGDGHVLARLLAEHTGLFVHVFSVCPLDELDGDALLNARRLPDEVEVAVGDRLPEHWLRHGTVVVDALLGTGIKGSLRQPYLDLVRQVNEANLPTIAVDIPSGVNADTGEVTDTAVVADLTVTMALPKRGLLLGDGIAHTGCLRVVDIGIPDTFVAPVETEVEAIVDTDVRPCLTRLPKTAHKGDMGRLLVIGGARQYPGAPMLTAHAALRSGGGLVAIVYPRSMAPLLRPPANSLILVPVEDHDEGFHQADAPAWGDLLAEQDVIAVGPGISREVPAMHLVEAVLATRKPVVLDADGLHVFQDSPGVLPRRAPTVITPHPGEMRRLLDAVELADLAEADRLTQAREVASRLACHVVLKGAGTILAAPDGRTAVNTTGTPGLASGGSGDVLTGMIAAFLAQLDDPWAAMTTAVYLHGLAAELSLTGQRNLIADDLPELIGEAMEQVSPFA